jgi:hypothetical protein
VFLSWSFLVVAFSTPSPRLSLCVALSRLPSRRWRTGELTGTTREPDRGRPNSAAALAATRSTAFDARDASSRSDAVSDVR